MYYKNTPRAFLFITIVGVLCIISVSMIGEKGFIFFTALILHPIFVEKVKSKPDINFWKLNLKIGTISLFLTSLTFIFIYFISIWFFNSALKPQTWHYIIFPYYVFITGIVGLFLISKPK